MAEPTARGESTRANRSPRETDTREHSERKAKFQIPKQEMIPSPNPHPDWDYRWVRLTFAGQFDNKNYNEAIRAQWEPVSKQDVPELDYVISDISHPLMDRVDDAIVIGGLILCRRDKAITQAYVEHNQQEVISEMKAYNTEYENEGSDPRMKKFSEIRTSVRFGD